MNQELHQTYKLSLTPQLKQSINILQMDSLQLEQYLQQVSQENPMLDLDIENSENQRVSEEVILKEMQALREMGEESRNAPYAIVDDNNPINAICVESNETLASVIYQQLNILELTNEQLNIACRMIEMLDENGYWLQNADTPSALGCDIDAANNVLAKLQTLEPAGIFARSLQECLLLQLDRMPADVSLTKRLVNEHMEDLAKNRLKHIASKCGIGIDEVVAAKKLIASLNPRPGEQYSFSPLPIYIMPDVIIEQVNNEWCVRLGYDAHVHVSINPYYYRMVKHGDLDTDAKNYLIDRYKQAKSVVRSIEQRKATILHCSEVLLQLQMAFFLNGPGHERIMSLNDIAEKIGVHVSTVSRTIKGKFLQCRWGVYPLRHFLLQTVSAVAKEEDSSKYIQALISQMIEKEDKRNPVSDSEISRLLAQNNIDIARRTVTKYRKLLGVPSTSMRKEYG